MKKTNKTGLEGKPDLEKLIASLRLERHPEGGWYRETYRATESVPSSALPARFGGERAFGTAIYYLLTGGDFSALHRIKSDELWHFYAGSGLTIHQISPAGEYRRIKLGADHANGETFQAMVAAGSWFGAEVSVAGGYALVGCTVAPGFDFRDFEIADRNYLLKTYPAHGKIICRLTAGDP